MITLKNVLTWAGIVGASGVAVFLLFSYLVSMGYITIIGHSGDMACSGTVSDPCTASITFKAVKDFSVSGNKQWMFKTDKELSSLRVYLNGVETNFSKTTKFNKNQTYVISFVGYKKNPSDIIKWSFDNLDPYWLPPTQDNYNLTQTENLTFTGNQNITRVFQIYRYANITSSSLNLSGLNKVGYCYQESANTSNQSGTDGKCNLNYSGGYNITGYTSSGNTIDGNWSSYGYATPTGIGNITVNYTKPSGITSPSAIWQFEREGSTITNTTIPSDCFNYYGNIISLKTSTDSGASPIYTDLFCYNGTWKKLEHFNTSSYYVYEEAIFWVINSYETANLCYQESANVSTSCGGLSTGSYANYTVGDGVDTGYINVTYSVPTDATIQSLWQVKSGCSATSNYSIPSSCWKSNITFRIESYNYSVPPMYYFLNFYCWDGASWQIVGGSMGTTAGTLVSGNYVSNAYDENWNTGTVYVSGLGWCNQTNTCSNGEIFEEAMWWRYSNITNPAVYINKTKVWNKTGFFWLGNQTSDLSSVLNSAINNGNCDCTGCSLSGNYCKINLTFHSDSAGNLTYYTNTIDYTILNTSISLSGVNNISFYSTNVATNATQPAGQNSTIGIFNVTNSNNFNVSIYAKINSTNTLAQLKINNVYNWTSSKILNTTNQNIYNCMLNNSQTYLWLWADYLNSSSKCYQETANISTCGNQNQSVMPNGTYYYNSSLWNNVSALFDGDWNTYSYQSSNSTPADFYVKYQKPNYAYNATWQVKDNSTGAFNISIPKPCFTNPLYLKVHKEKINSSGTYNAVQGSGTSCARIYVNYTKPTYVTSAKWLVKHGNYTDTAYDVVIPDSCFSYYPTVIVLQFCSNSLVVAEGSGTTGSHSEGFCLNATGWQQITQTKSLSGTAYDRSYASPTLAYDGDYNTYVSGPLWGNDLSPTSPSSSRIYGEEIEWNYIPSYYYCKNNTAWQLLTSNNKSNVFYEEAVYWDMESRLNTTWSPDIEITIGEC